jgi:hypothetical protein
VKKPGIIDDFGFFLAVRSEICVVWETDSPHPSPLPREREPIACGSKPEFGSVSQVGVSTANTSVSPLSLWERARVRVLFDVQAAWE